MLLLAIGHEFYMVLGDTVQRCLEEIGERRHEAVFAVPSSHQYDNLREKRLACRIVHEDECEYEFLIREERVVVYFKVPDAVSKRRSVKEHVLPLERGLDDIPDQQFAVTVDPLGVFFAVREIFIYFLTGNHP